MEKDSILIDEDNLGLRGTLFKGLSKYGIRANIAETAEEGLWSFGQKDIADVKLPGLNGLQFSESI